MYCLYLKPGKYINLQIDSVRVIHTYTKLFCVQFVKIILYPLQERDKLAKNLENLKQKRYAAVMNKKVCLNFEDKIVFLFINFAF